MIEISKELKALEFLKEQRRRHQNMADSMKVIYFDDELDEAIKELEELNNKSCSKCNNNIFNKGGKEYGCNRIEINPKDMKQVGFYCSKYEAKGE